MKSLSINAGSSASTISLHHNHTLRFLGPKPPSIFSLPNPISLSLSKPTCPTPSSSSSSPPSLLISPHFVPPNGDEPISNLAHYADIASKLAKDGLFEDFGMVVDCVLSSDVDRVLGFGKLLNLELVKEGIVKGLKEGRVKNVVGLLGRFPQLGIDLLGLFDSSAMELLKRVCVKIVNNGNLGELVELMETFAGFQFPIRELVTTNDVIKMFVDRRSPSLAVRYFSLLPHADIMFCTIICEFGKKIDLVSSLRVFEASKLKMNGNNMYVYRTIIDVCGLCGDCYKSRLIYEDLLVQKITPNIYVFNSLMNVNAHDLTYTMEVYQKMQNLGVEADMTSYNILLKACYLSGRVDMAQDIYREVQRLESTGALKMDVFTYSTIIKVFADAKLWQLAIKVKEDMLSAGVSPNTVTWSSLISACAKAGLVDQATQLFEEMLIAGCRPNSQCFNTLLHACVEGCQYDRAFRLFNTWKSSGSSRTSLDNSEDNKDTDSSVQLIDEDCCTSTPYCATASRHLSFARSVPFKPTTTTYNILLKACGADLYRAKALIDEMRILCLSPNHISWSILIDICGARGNIDGALQILKSMNESGLKPDVVAYTTAIKVCVESKNLKTAFSLFAEMKRYLIKPNLVTYNTLLRARSRYGSLQEIQQCLAIYQDMRKAGLSYKPNNYYLKQLVEGWCEEVIQMNNQGGQYNSRNRADIGGLRSLLLERVATHLQKNTTESFAVDVQGLTKVEARLVVLAALRMIKENQNSERRVKDDLIIIIGIRDIDAECMVKDAILKLLKQELGLEISSVKPIIKVDRVNTGPNSNSFLETSEASRRLDAPSRRPAVLQRLLVSKKSLNYWLQRRSSASTKC